MQTCLAIRRPLAVPVKRQRLVVHAVDKDAEAHIMQRMHPKQGTPVNKTGPPLLHKQTVWNGEGPDYTMADVERFHEMTKLEEQPVWNGEGAEYNMHDVEVQAMVDALKEAAAAPENDTVFNGEGQEFMMTDIHGKQ